MRTRSLVLRVALVVLAGCGATTGVPQTIPLASPTEFSTKIKRITVRVVDPEVVVLHGPKWVNDIPAEFSDLSTHHVGVPEIVKEVLEKKGYVVTFVWDNPWGYGPKRPCLLGTPTMSNPADGPPRMLAITPDPAAGPCPRRPDDYHGYQYQMSRFGGVLEPDQAFLEIGTISDVQTTTSTSTTSTESEVGRVTDANGATVGTVYQNGTSTQTQQHEKKFSSATMQIFTSDHPEAVMDVQAWSEENAFVGPVTRRVLDLVPAKRAP